MSQQPVRYVEYDADGNITQVVEVHVTEGTDAPSIPAEPLYEDGNERQIAAARLVREEARRRRDSIVERLHKENKERAFSAVRDRKARGERLVLLDDGAETPDPSTHKVAAGRIRPLTAAEVKARNVATPPSGKPVR